MEKAKHTPGPWEYKSGGEGAFPQVILAKSMPYSDGSGGADHDEYLTINVGPSAKGLAAGYLSNDTETCEANARLIAAAPETAAERDRLKENNAELLEALEAMVDMVAITVSRRDFAYSLSSTAFDNARTAIAKAKGGKRNETDTAIL